MDDQKSKEQKARKSDHDPDSFWDISDLLPRRRPPVRRPPNSTDAVDIKINQKGVELQIKKDVFTDEKLNIKLSDSQKNTKTKESSDTAALADNTATKWRFIPPYTEKDIPKPQLPDEEYSPIHPLIRSVKIYNRKSSYNYYEQFLRHAQKIKNLEGKESPPASFFSYVPQYSQLSRAQLAWYLWWRRCVSRGEFLATDYSYILLYIYEIINTDGHGDPLWGQEQLVNIWRGYRATFSRLDRLLGDWICDFSLIHRLEAPDLDKAKIPTSALQYCVLREFYSVVKTGSSDTFANMLLSGASNYDFKNSKFARGEDKKLFSKHIEGALSEVVARFSSKQGQLFSLTNIEASRITRDAFAGALCSYRIKKKLEIEYFSFSRSHELRFLVTDIVKYSENRIRAYLGIKSRLGVHSLPVPVRQCIDEYFDKNLPKKQKPPKAEEDTIYERFYDSPATEVSPERAAQIELLSWENTRRLVEAFSDEEADEDDVTLTAALRILQQNDVAQKDTIMETECDYKASGLSHIKESADKNAGIKKAGKDTPDSLPGDDKNTPPDGASQSCTPHGNDLLDGGSLRERLGELWEFICLADERDFAGQKTFAKRLGMMPELIADKINEAAAETIGDVILEEEDGGYSLIEDYRGEVFDG